MAPGTTSDTARLDVEAPAQGDIGKIGTDVIGLPLLDGPAAARCSTVLSQRNESAHVGWLLRSERPRRTP
jgi:hypothetical protein